MEVSSSHSHTVTITLSQEDIQHLETALPKEAEVPEGEVEVSGLLPSPRFYCVKVYKKSIGGGLISICQKTMYETPLWIWARAAILAVRHGGDTSQTSEGRCQGPQNTCGEG
jgi:hypothetical protein